MMNEMPLGSWSEIFGLFDEKGGEADVASEVLRLVSGVEATEIEPGRPAPEFTLAQQDGSLLRLSDFRGKVVLLDFWSEAGVSKCRASFPWVPRGLQGIQGPRY